MDALSPQRSQDLADHVRDGPISLPVLTDGRVILRAPEPADLPAIDTGMHDPDVVRWIGPPWPIDDVLGRLEALLAKRAPTFVICEPDGSFAGMVWVNVRDDDRSTGWVGYWLLPAARGRGLATGAVRLITDWAVNKLGFTTMRLKTAPDNERSQRLAERSGFRRMSPIEGEPDGPDAGQVIFELLPGS